MAKRLFREKSDKRLEEENKIKFHAVQAEATLEVLLQLHPELKDDTCIYLIKRDFDAMLREP